MTPDFLYHICDRADWEADPESAVYLGTLVDRRDGFIHLSTANQVATTLERHFAGRDGLVLLQIAVARLPVAPVWERADGRGTAMPHLYSDLPRRAVVAVDAVPLDASGVPNPPPLQERSEP